MKLQKALLCGIMFFLLISSQAFSGEFKEIGNIDLPGYKGGIKVRAGENFAYCTDYHTSALTVIDISDKTNAYIRGGLQNLSNSNIHEEWYADGYVYTSHRNGDINMINVSDPDAPQIVSTANAVYSHGGLLTYENYLFYGQHSAGQELGGIIVYDVSDGTLDRVGDCLGDIDGRWIAITSDGKYAYQASAKDQWPYVQMVIYDISEKTKPTGIGTFNEGTFGKGLAISSDNNYLYIATSDDWNTTPLGLEIWDISDRANPVLTSTFSEVKGNCLALDTNNNVLFTFTHKNTLYALDVSDPLNVAVIDSVPDLGVEWLDFKDGLLYLGCTVESKSEYKMRIFELPCTPSEMAVYHVSTLPSRRPNQYFTVKVFDAGTHNPIADAAVTLTYSENVLNGFTDAAGKCILKIDYTDSHTFQLTVTKNSYLTYENYIKTTGEPGLSEIYKVTYPGFDIPSELVHSGLFKQSGAYTGFEIDAIFSACDSFDLGIYNIQNEEVVNEELLLDGAIPGDEIQVEEDGVFGFWIANYFGNGAKHFSHSSKGNFEIYGTPFENEWFIGYEDGGGADHNDLVWVVKGIVPFWETIVQAETMQNRKNRFGSPCTDGWKLTHQDQPIYEDVQFPQDGLYHFTITAKGEIDGGAAPWLKVELGDVFKGCCEVNSTEWAEYTFVASIPAGTHRLNLTFLNDWWQENVGDRNLLIDKVEINYQTDPPPVTAFTFDAENMRHQHPKNYQEDEWVVFTRPYAYVAHDMYFENHEDKLLTFVIYAKGDSVDAGWPQMDLRIDGKTVGSVSVDNANRMAYLFNLLSIASGKHRIKIAYNSDSWASGRNLYIDKLVIIAPYGGLLKSGNEILSDSEPAMNIPRTFALKQNYPNPFNPDTQISYQLPENTRVVISIFNSLGQEIRRLVNENKPAGNHSAYWNGLDNDGESVVSGIYLYRIQAGSFVCTKKMAILK